MFVFFGLINPSRLALLICLVYICACVCKQGGWCCSRRELSRGYPDAGDPTPWVEGKRINIINNIGITTTRSLLAPPSPPTINRHPPTLLFFLLLLFASNSVAQLLTRKRVNDAFIKCDRNIALNDDDDYDDTFCDW